MMQQEGTLTVARLLERYQRGERDFRFVELDAAPESDFSGVSLDGADFTSSWIIASFRGTSLRAVRFVNANLKTCDFRDADLRDADFTGAALCATRFEGARLDGARFDGAFCHSRQLSDGEQPDW